MRPRVMRSIGAMLAAGVLVGVSALVMAPAIGHESDDDKVMQSRGGHSMMGMGYGMTGRGMIGQGAMGYGRHGECFRGAAVTDRNFSVADVTKILEGRLVWRGNPRLKVGKVTEKDEKTIIAEIVTVDDSLVQRLAIDRKTGRATRVN